MGSDRFPGLPSNCRRCRPQDGPSRPACRRSPRRRSPTSSCRSMPFAARRPAVPSRWLSTCGSTSSGRPRRRVRVQVDLVCVAAWPVGPGQRRRLPQTQAAARVEPSQSHTEGRPKTSLAAANSGSSVASGSQSPASMTRMASVAVGGDRVHGEGQRCRPPRRGRRMPPFRSPATSAPSRRRSACRPAKS